MFFTIVLGYYLVHYQTSIIGMLFSDDIFPTEYIENVPSGDTSTLLEYYTLYQLLDYLENNNQLRDSEITLYSSEIDFINSFKHKPDIKDKLVLKHYNNVLRLQNSYNVDIKYKYLNDIICTLIFENISIAEFNGYDPFFRP